MNIGGMLKFSLIDYPGKIAAVIFTQGCNFRCPYCHNRDLVLPEYFRKPLPENEVMAFLQKRIGQIDGVVVTGGEPTIQPDLIRFLRDIKDLGYPVKLDTNGSRPGVIQEVLREKLVDYIAMDVKMPLEKYCLLTQERNCFENIRSSVKTIINSSVMHEFRTTLVKTLVDERDLPALTALIQGARKYRLQNFIPRDTVLDKNLLRTAIKHFSEEEVAVLQERWGFEHEAINPV